MVYDIDIGDKFPGITNDEKLRSGALRTAVYAAVH